MKNFHPTGNCPVRDVLSRLGDKWSMLVLITLSANGTMRFSDIHKTIADVSQRILAHVGIGWSDRTKGLCGSSSPSRILLNGKRIKSYSPYPRLGGLGVAADEWYYGKPGFTYVMTCSGINLSVSFFCKNICQRPLG